MMHKNRRWIEKPLNDVSKRELGEILNNEIENMVVAKINKGKDRTEITIVIGYKALLIICSIASTIYMLKNLIT